MNARSHSNISVLRSGAIVFGGALTVSLFGLAASPVTTAAALGTQAGKQAAVTGPVSRFPAAGTPELAPTGTSERVRQLVQCGDTIYAVGSFTEISQSGNPNSPFSRNNVFSFRATAPYTVTSWNPDVNGVVDSIAFNGGNCSDAYIGGKFSSVGGTPVENIAEVSTSTGAVITGFAAQASAEVETLLAVDRHLLVGGRFSKIDGSTADGFMASLNPATGANDGFIQTNISGHMVYHDVRANSTYIYNQQLSHSGTLDLVEGDFTEVGGLPRQQIFMLNLATNPATVTAWSSPEWDGSQGTKYAYQCGDSHPVYIQAAAWSPDDQTVYIATTGYHPWNEPTGTYPRQGLCDAVAAFPATQTEVLHDWVNYTGCNSLYSVAADNSAVYVGGHERWADNNVGCKFAGTGAIPAPGMGGFTPGTLGGTLLRNHSGTVGLYSRSRGMGADDMLLTGAGLWIASDNFQGSDSCGHVSGHAGICFLPSS